MVPKFADYWKKKTGFFPARLLFDSCDDLCRAEPIDQTSDRFHHHPPAWFEHVDACRASAFGLLGALPDHSGQGEARLVQYVDESVQLDDYDGSVRQLIVTGLGHESPTFFLTNDLPEPQTAREVIQTYASRNHIENHLGEQITFFHLDCLCSDVRLNVEFDLTLTVLADLLYC